MQSFLNSLEQKLGRFAIPGIVRFIMGAQVIVWLLSLTNQFGGVMEMLFLNPFALESGSEWWRVVSFLFMPIGSGILWLLMGVPFMWMVGDGLEHAWGAFRVNLFMLACVVCVTTESLAHMTPVFNGLIIFLSLIMAFSVYYPDQEVSLYGIIPLKMKWIGLMDFGFVLFRFIGADSAERWQIFAAMLPFLSVFGPGIYQQTHHTLKTMERRQRYVSAQKSPTDSLHQCARCGKTEKDDPHLDFRVNGEGDDVCSECRGAPAR